MWTWERHLRVLKVYLECQGSIVENLISVLFHTPAVFGWHPNISEKKETCCFVAILIHRESCKMLFPATHCFVSEMYFGKLNYANWVEFTARNGGKKSSFNKNQHNSLKPMTWCYCFKAADSAFYQDKKIEVNIRPETSHDTLCPQAVAHIDVRQNQQGNKDAYLILLDQVFQLKETNVWNLSLNISNMMSGNEIKNIINPWKKWKWEKYSQ